MSVDVLRCGGAAVLRLCCCGCAAVLLVKAYVLYDEAMLRPETAELSIIIHSNANLGEKTRESIDGPFSEAPSDLAAAFVLAASGALPLPMSFLSSSTAG